MNARVPFPATPARFDVLKAESFVRGESMLAMIVDAPAAVVCARLERWAAEMGYAVLARRDLARRQPDASPNWAQGSALFVYEIAPHDVLAQLLAADPAMAHALPCRIVVHDVHGPTTVSTPRPAVVWPTLSHAPEIARIAQDLEHALQRLFRGLQ